MGDPSRGSGAPRPDMAAAAAGASTAPSSGIATGRAKREPTAPRGAPLPWARRGGREPESTPGAALWARLPPKNLPPSLMAPHPQGAGRHNAGRGGGRCRGAGALYPAGSRRNLELRLEQRCRRWASEEQRRRRQGGGQQGESEQPLKEQGGRHLLGCAEPRSLSPAAWSARRRPAPWARG